MSGLTLYGKLIGNYFFSDLLNKLKDNKLVIQHNIKNNMGLFTLIYSDLVIDDISKFQNNEKTTLDDSTKDIILKIIQEIILPKQLPFTDEELSFDKESVVFYSFVLETLRRLVSCDFDEYFVRNFEDFEDEDDMLLIRVEGHNEAVSDVIYQVLNRTVYDYIIRMKSVKQNAIQKEELETITIKKNLPEDVEKNILAFANNTVKGGRKSKKSSRKTKKRIL
jgi:hypothetical protein